MDTGKGSFVKLEEEARIHSLKEAQKALEEQYPEHGGWFRVGEILELRGSRFRVKAVKPTELHLKLLPKK